MKASRYRPAWQVLPAPAVWWLFGLSVAFATPVTADSENAFRDRFMFRLASYNVRDADTDMTVLSKEGLGTGFSYTDDLGGDDQKTVPRIDAYIRFHENHRIEFSHFRIERDGRQRLQIDLDIGDESYSIGDTVVSSIDYELFKIDYAYSFYHSPSVELSVSAGLNLTSYDFDYELVDGSSTDSSDTSGPLPMFGIQMSYRLSRNWSLHYVSEAFFIKLEDELEGSIQTIEMHVDYRVHKNFVLGVGASRFSIDLDARDRDWNGKLDDSHRALIVYGSFYI